MSQVLHEAKVILLDLQISILPIITSDGWLHGINIGDLGVVDHSAPIFDFKLIFCGVLLISLNGHVGIKVLPECNYVSELFNYFWIPVVLYLQANPYNIG